MTKPRSEPDQLRRVANEPWLQVLPERTQALIRGSLRDAADRIDELEQAFVDSGLA